MDCVERPFQPPSSVQAAIARQEPPAKSLLIYLHDAIGEDAAVLATSGPHVAGRARDGSSGLLAFTARGTDVAAAAADLLGVDPSSAMPAETLGQR